MEQRPILILKNRQLLDAISSRSDYSCRWVSNFFILENATASTVLCEFVVNVIPKTHAWPNPCKLLYCKMNPVW